MNRSKLLAKTGMPGFYISCVLAAIEGEGDPRNLMVVFDLLQFVLLNFCNSDCLVIANAVLEPFVEDIFDKVSCYFPINFTPPKDDKFKITPEALKVRLKNCFLACDHPTMIENAFPFIIQKITDDSADTKRDGLEILEGLIAKLTLSQAHEKHLEMSISALLNEYFNRFDL